MASAGFLRFLDWSKDISKLSDELAASIKSISSGMVASIDDALLSGNLDDVEKLRDDLVQAADDAGDLDAKRYLENPSFLKTLKIESQYVQLNKMQYGVIANGSDLNANAIRKLFPDVEPDIRSATRKYVSEANDSIKASAEEFGKPIEEVRNDWLRLNDPHHPEYIKIDIEVDDVAQNTARALDDIEVPAGAKFRFSDNPTSAEQKFEYNYWAKLEGSPNTIDINDPIFDDIPLEVKQVADKLEKRGLEEIDAEATKRAGKNYTEDDWNKVRAEWLLKNDPNSPTYDPNFSFADNASAKPADDALEGDVLHPNDPNYNGGGTKPADDVAESIGKTLPNTPKGFAAKLEASVKNMSAEDAYDKIEEVREIHLSGLFGAQTTKLKSALSKSEKAKINKAPTPADKLNNAQEAMHTLANRIQNGDISIENARIEMQSIKEAHKQASEAFSEGVAAMKKDLTNISNELANQSPIHNWILRTPVVRTVARSILLSPINALNPLHHWKHIIPDPLQQFQTDALKKMADHSIEMLDEVTSKNLVANHAFDNASKDIEKLISSGEGADKIAKSLYDTATNLQKNVEDVTKAGQEYLEHVLEPKNGRYRHNEDKYARQRGILQGLYNNHEQKLKLNIPSNKRGENPEAHAMQIEHYWQSRIGPDGKVADADVTDAKQIAGLLFLLYRGGEGHAGIKSLRRLIRSGGKDRGKTAYGLPVGKIMPEETAHYLLEQYKARASVEGLSGNVKDDPHFQDFMAALDEMISTEKNRQSPERWGERDGLMWRNRFSQVYEDAFEFTQGFIVSPAVLVDSVINPFQDRLLGLRKNAEGTVRPTWRTPFNATTGFGFTGGVISAVGGGAIVGSASVAEWAGLDESLGLETETWNFTDGYRPQVWMSDFMINDVPSTVTGWFGANDGKGYGLPVYDYLYNDNKNNEKPEEKVEKTIGGEKMKTDKVIGTTLEEMKAESKAAIGTAQDKIEAITKSFGALSTQVGKLEKLRDKGINDYIKVFPSNEDKYKEIRTQLSSSIMSLRSRMGADLKNATTGTDAILAEIVKNNTAIEGIDDHSLVETLRAQQIETMAKLPDVTELNQRREKEIDETYKKYDSALRDAKPLANAVLADNIVEDIKAEQAAVAAAVAEAVKQKAIDDAAAQKIIDDAAAKKIIDDAAAQKVIDDAKAADKVEADAKVKLATSSEGKKALADLDTIKTAIKKAVKEANSNITTAEKMLKTLGNRENLIKEAKEELEEESGAENKTVRLRKLDDLIASTKDTHEKVKDKITLLKAVSESAKTNEANANTLIKKITASADELGAVSVQINELSTLAQTVSTDTASTDLGNQILEIYKENTADIQANKDVIESESALAQAQKGAIQFGGKYGLLNQLISPSANGADSPLAGVGNMLAGAFNGASGWLKSLKRGTTSDGQRLGINLMETGGGMLAGWAVLSTINDWFFGGKMGGLMKGSIMLAIAGFFLNRSGKIGEEMVLSSRDIGLGIPARDELLKKATEKPENSSRSQTNQKPGANSAATTHAPQGTTELVIRKADGSKTSDIVIVVAPNGMTQAMKNGALPQNAGEVTMSNEMKNALTQSIRGKCGALNVGDKDSYTLLLSNKAGTEELPVEISYSCMADAANDADFLIRANK